MKENNKKESKKVEKKQTKNLCVRFRKMKRRGKNGRKIKWNLWK